MVLARYHLRHTADMPGLKTVSKKPSRGTTRDPSERSRSLRPPTQARWRMGRRPLEISPPRVLSFNIGHLVVPDVFRPCLRRPSPSLLTAISTRRRRRRGLLGVGIRHSTSASPGCSCDERCGGRAVAMHGARRWRRRLAAHPPLRFPSWRRQFVSERQFVSADLVSCWRGA